MHVFKPSHLSSFSLSTFAIWNFPSRVSTLTVASSIYLVTTPSIISTSRNSLRRTRLGTKFNNAIEAYELPLQCLGVLCISFHRLSPAQLDRPMALHLFRLWLSMVPPWDRWKYGISDFISDTLYYFYSQIPDVWCQCSWNRGFFALVVSFVDPQWIHEDSPLNNVRYFHNTRFILYKRVLYNLCTFTGFDPFITGNVIVFWTWILMI